jgi:hypothetical protein
MTTFSLHTILKARKHFHPHFPDELNWGSQRGKEELESHSLSLDSE